MKELTNEAYNKRLDMLIDKGMRDFLAIREIFTTEGALLDVTSPESTETSMYNAVAVFLSKGGERAEHLMALSVEGNEIFVLGAITATVFFLKQGSPQVVWGDFVQKHIMLGMFKACRDYARSSLHPQVLTRQ